MSLHQSIEHKLNARNSFFLQSSSCILWRISDDNTGTLRNTLLTNSPKIHKNRTQHDHHYLLTDEVFTHHAASAPAPSAAATQLQVAASRSLLPKAASQSGLRPPGFSSSRVAAGRLAAFGFVRSSSVSSVTSTHSADSTQSDACRATHRESVKNKDIIKDDVTVN